MTKINNGFRHLSVLQQIAVFILLTISSVSSLAASKDFQFWLTRMSYAIDNLNYDGYFVYLHNNTIESLRTVNRIENGNKTERLFSQNGEPREIVRDSDSVTSILPGQKKLSTARRPLDPQTFSSFFRLDPDRIEENYLFRLTGKNRVADRMVNVIEFTPKDAMRYGYRLYLDNEYALPLQWEMFDQNNVPVSSIMFTNINIQPEQADITVSDKTPVKSKTVLRSTAALQNNWPFGDAPAGYALHHHSSSMHHDSHRQIDHYLFSDGLASFSVYVEASPKAKLDGAARLGPMNAYGVYRDGVQITAVGEVPVEALIFIDLSSQAK